MPRHFSRSNLPALVLAGALCTFVSACTGGDPDDDDETSPTPVTTPTPVPNADADNDDVPVPLDCDDTNPDIYPGAVEVCNDKDDDCSGEVDDNAIDQTTYYADDDGDSYGDLLSPARACEQPPGYVTDRGDCDDANLEVNPTRTEICGDGLDNDCDGTAGDCGLGGTVTLSMADFTATGAAADDRAGCSVSPAGDVNQDGHSDLIVGAYFEDSGGSSAGAAYLLYGPLSGSSSLASAGAIFVGEESLDRAGIGVAGVGDVNADGYDDVLIGAYYNDRGGRDSGTAYLFHGPVNGTQDLSDADAFLIGEVSNSTGSTAGYSVAAGGDINDDGFADMLVGAYYFSSDENVYAGASYVVYGPVGGDVPLQDADARILGASYAGFSGYSVAGGGDLNGDGYDDVLIGAWGSDTNGADSGNAYLFYGPLSGTLTVTDADAIITGATGEEAGRNVSILGDVNSDGYDDLLVGAPVADGNGQDSGAAYVFFGPLEGALTTAEADAILLGELPGSQLGESGSPAGDVNGDGADDFLVGARGEVRGRTTSRAAYLVFGPVEGTTILDVSTAAARFISEEVNDAVGYDVAGGADFNGDDVPDVVLGVPQRDTDAEFAGAVYGFFGGVGL